MIRTRRAIIARRLRATYMNTQLSRFLTVSDRPILAAHPPDLCPVSGKRIAHTRWSRQRLRRSLYHGFFDFVGRLVQ
jgi:hypothetical protein